MISLVKLGSEEALALTKDESITDFLQEEYADAKTPVGIDLASGEALVPADTGIWDNYRVKRQLLHSW